MKNFWKAANFKGHLLTAISYMIPIVCGAGFVMPSVWPSAVPARTRL